MQRVSERLHVRYRINGAGQTAARESPGRFCRAAQVRDHVAKLGRVLEIHFLRSGAHLFFECGDHLSRFAFQKLARLRYALAVLLGADLAQADGHLICRGL